jgi:hypothetical protein
MSDGIRSGVNWMRLELSPRTVPSVVDQLGLGEAGHADQQRMTPGQDREEGLLDDAFLSEDDIRDGLLYRGDSASACSAAAMTAFSSIGFAPVSMRPMGVSARSGSSLSG